MTYQISGSYNVPGKIAIIVEGNPGDFQTRRGYDCGNGCPYKGFSMPEGDVSHEFSGDVNVRDGVALVNGCAGLRDSAILKEEHPSIRKWIPPESVLSPEKLKRHLTDSWQEPEPTEKNIFILLF